MTIFQSDLTLKKTEVKENPIWVMVHKEVSAHLRSWQFIVLLILIILTFFGSMYVAMSNLGQVVSNTKDPDHLLIYLKLLTVTDGSLPPFHVFINFLGPILGISLGFNAINSEQQQGTLTRIMAQPIYRDNVLLSKFISSILIVSTLLLSLTLLMIGGGILLSGVLIELEELLRILFYVVICVFYISFWYGLAIIFSIKFKQPATSAITSMGVWIFLTIFYSILINLLSKVLLNGSTSTSYSQSAVVLNLMGLTPSQLYNDATTTLLIPKVRSLGPLSMEQMAGAIPNSLPFGESIMIVWPQISGLVAVTIVTFAIAYYLFMRKEVKN